MILTFPGDVRHHAVLPSRAVSAMRTAFDLLMNLAGIRPVVLAQLDEMALRRHDAGATGGRA